MKMRISATIDKEIFNIIKNLRENRRKYRSNSHIIEDAVLLLNEVENDKRKK